jgi:hypothetical protein
MRAPYFGCALIAVMLATQLAPARAADSATVRLSAHQQSVYASAVDAFRQHRYSAAYGRFAQLADDGHAPSAQLALVMYQNGPMLFGSNWDATPEQIEYWRELIIKDERAL